MLFDRYIISGWFSSTTFIAYLVSIVAGYVAPHPLALPTLPLRPTGGAVSVCVRLSVFYGERQVLSYQLMLPQIFFATATLKQRH